MPGSPVCTPEWLTLREGADASARAPELVEPLRARLSGPLVIRDLGCGSGSMGRWLAGRLPGPQHWVLCDRDPGLLARASAGLPSAAAHGEPVTTETVLGDATGLDAGDLAGTSLVTASALLDLLTREEVDRLAGACVGAGCAALFTLTVSGGARLEPAEPLDAEFAAAFDAHQRRRTGGRRLLGPDAGRAAVDAFARLGAKVRTAPSPWRLDADRAELLEEWLRGWLAAACEQRPDLRRHADGYLRRRLGAADLEAVVGHLDVLALPGGAG
ncbi:trans-aconitate methyltransferase [Pseudonocardia eucalypti]|uniref:Trans-aconitate methyltransferase n=1 Tax=Pseudonocardia eucalypti TaxID=648755 RepID=A0ABP9PVC9_9PSEU|nr:SAM-dependent methyltransferase [Pseudonocardia eucalypti]